MNRKSLRRYEGLKRIPVNKISCTTISNTQGDKVMKCRHSSDEQNIATKLEFRLDCTCMRDGQMVIICFVADGRYS